MLPGSDDHAFAVAHCRKQGLGQGQYGDIAVIQHNRDNGATCFYQALAEWEDEDTRTRVKTPLNGDVKAPSKGTSAWQWLTPEKTATHRLCRLPRQRADLSLAVFVAGDEGRPAVCFPVQGTARSTTINPTTLSGRTLHRGGPTRSKSLKTPATIAIVWVSVTSSSTEGQRRARRECLASAPRLHHNRTRTRIPSTSPIWTCGMNIVDPPDVLYSQVLADAAKAIKDCAMQFRADAPLPNTSTCKITRFTGSNEFAPPIDDRFGLAVASWGPNRLDLFGVGTDGAMYHKAWDGIWRPSPSGWEHLGGIFTSTPAVVASGSDRLDVFGLGTDRSLFHAAWAPDTGWTAWETLGGTFASPPAVVSWGPNRLDIFGVGADGAMYHKAWDGAWRPSPSGWEHLGGVFTSPPAVVAWASDRLDVFGLGTDRSLFHKAWAPDTGWTCLGAPRWSLRESAGGRVMGAESLRYLWCRHRWRDVSQSLGRWCLAPLGERLGASRRRLYQSTRRGCVGIRLAGCLRSRNRPQPVPQGVGARHGMELPGNPSEESLRVRPW